MDNTPSMPFPDHPAPPIPPFVDLRHYRDMPLEVQTLLDSTIAGVGDAEIFRCGLLLWCKSWQQVPCGSLEDDDSTLARACGLGRDLKTWSRMKAQVLRGFRKASDGRLYHWKVCTKAAEAWNSTAQWQWNKQCDALRKVNKGRKDAGQEPLPMPEKPGKVSCGWGKEGPVESGGSDAPTAPGSGGKYVTPAANSTGGSGGNPAENAGREEEGNRKGREEEGNPRKGYVGADAPPGTPPAIQERPPVNGAAPRLGEQVTLLGEIEDSIPVGLDRSPEGQAVRLWNETADRVNTEVGRTEWVRVQKISAGRRAGIRARLKDCDGIEGWKIALARAARDPWLRGESPRSPRYESWRFNIKTMVREEFFTNLMEKPDDGAPSRRRQGEPSGFEAFVAGAAKASSGG